MIDGSYIVEALQNQADSLKASVRQAEALERIATALEVIACGGVKPTALTRGQASVREALGLFADMRREAK